MRTTSVNKRPVITHPEAAQSPLDTLMGMFQPHFICCRPWASLDATRGTILDAAITWYDHRVGKGTNMKSDDQGLM
jgi:hypothetical protein